MHAVQKRHFPGRAYEAGQALAEFAVIALVLFLIVLGIIDLSRAVYAQNLITDAACAGARYAAVHPGDVHGVEAAARRMLIGIEPSAVSVTLTEHPASSEVQVDVAYTFHPVSFLIAGIVDQHSGTGLPLHASAVMGVE